VFRIEETRCGTCVFGNNYGPHACLRYSKERNVASVSGAMQGMRDWFRNLRGPDMSWSKKWPDPPRPVKIALVIVASILAVLILVFIAANILLANPKVATPFTNWSLKTFGGEGTAHVELAKLAHPFSNRFQVQTLDWPGTAEAEEIEVTYDLFGFLPGRPWARKLFLRNGEVMLEDKEKDRKTINPQALVDAVEVENLDIKFTRRNKLRQVKITEANGAFSTGTVTGEATSGKNRITFTRLRRAWDGSLDGAITASGDNLKDLAEIVGASAPDTPPFKVDGRLHMHERTWGVDELSGRVGDSDIAGAVSVDLKPEKPFLTVKLASQKLDFDDLGVVFGIPVGTGKGETTNAEQREAKAAFDRSSRLIPDTRIDFARLAAVNADFSFEAPKVIDAPSGINAMTFEGALRDQVLDFERFIVSTGSGNLDAKVKINATKDPARTTANGRLAKVPVTRIVKTTFVRGTLNGAFRLNMTGSGFREAFGSASGEAGIWSTNSEVAKIATEAAGLDLGEILLLLVTDEDREYLKSRCLAANLSFKDGRATLAPAVIDNEDSLIFAQGGFNLKDETLDIEVAAKPHDVSVGKVFGDIKITGTMRHPKLQALNSKTVLQAGFSALLSTITGALTALPFVEFGGEPEAPCQQLLADSRSLARQTPEQKARAPDKS
jgi:hypothetical protein